MARTVGIGHQDFEKVIKEDIFYVDKTKFIQEWWENKDEVTLITRPRRFGKTLNLSMVKKFFLSSTRAEATCLKIYIFGIKKNIVSCKGRTR
jgi:hypothetical protein